MPSILLLRSSRHPKTIVGNADLRESIVGIAAHSEWQMVD
jgi:hypothetical protein